MTSSAIHSLGTIIKVLYNKDQTIRSFLTGHKSNEDFYYVLYLKPKGGRYYYNRNISETELEEIKELLKSPLEKIDLDQLEKF